MLDLKPAILILFYYILKILKIVFIVIIIILIRVTVVRLKIESLGKVGWVVIIGVVLVNIIFFNVGYFVSF